MKALGRPDTKNTDVVTCGDNLLSALEIFDNRTAQTTAIEDRGLENVDLVDLRDGMICRNQITQEEMEGIVNVAMGFGYDYGVAPGSCD